MLPLVKFSHKNIRIYIKYLKCRNLSVSNSLRRHIKNAELERHFQNQSFCEYYITIAKILYLCPFLDFMFLYFKFLGFIIACLISLFLFLLSFLLYKIIFQTIIICIVNFSGNISINLSTFFQTKTLIMSSVAF